MSKFKGEFPMTVLILVVMFAAIGMLFVRTSTFAGELINKDKQIKYFFKNEETGSMMTAFLDSDISGFKNSVLLGSYNSEDFPSPAKETIEHILERIVEMTGKDGCSIKIITGEGTTEISKGDSHSSATPTPTTSNDLGITFKILPVKNPDTCFTTPFGWEEFTDLKGKDKWRFHRGLNFRGNGNDVVSVAPGYVVHTNDGCSYCNGGAECNCNSGLGNTITIMHKMTGDNGEVTFYTFYHHLASVDVSIGERVGEGQKIGTIGNSGYSTGPHLHFSVAKTATYNNDYTQFINPCELFSEDALKPLLSKSSADSCNVCQSGCLIPTLNADNPDQIQSCIVSAVSSESGEIPLPGGKSGTVTIECY